MNAFLLTRCVFACLLCIAFAGCGKEDGPTYAAVKGKVTLDGKVVQSGSVLFVPQGGTDPNSGGSASGTIGRDGTFELVGPGGKGVVIGTHKVLVQCPEEGSGPDTGENPLKDLPPCKIPRKYALETTTDITKTVEEGENEILIELTSKRKKKK